MSIIRPYFSVLIPVYNTERYLYDCINSVLKQKYIDFEIILMDDGSTDNSLNVCNEFSRKDERIRTFHKENEGLLLTRRKLFKEMRGQYAICLDSDDCLAEGALELVHNVIEQKSCDMLVGRIRTIGESFEQLRESPILFQDRSVFEGLDKQLFVDMFLSSGELNSLAIKVVKSEIIDKNKDYSDFVDVKGEDLLQSISLISRANRIVYISDVIYLYRYIKHSRTNLFKEDHIRQINNVQFEVLTFSKLNASNQRVINRSVYNYLNTQRYLLNRGRLSKNHKLWTKISTEMTNSKTINLAEEISKGIFLKIYIFLISCKNEYATRIYLFLAYYGYKAYKNMIGILKSNHEKDE